MTSAIFDYADIRSRMLGEDKPKPKLEQFQLKQEVGLPGPVCTACNDSGWIATSIYGMCECRLCGNPKKKPSP